MHCRKICGACENCSEIPIRVGVLRLIWQGVKTMADENDAMTEEEIREFKADHFRATGRELSDEDVAEWDALFQREAAKLNRASKKLSRKKGALQDAKVENSYLKRRNLELERELRKAKGEPGNGDV